MVGLSLLILFQVAAIFVPLNFRLTGRELQYIINDAGVHTLIAVHTDDPIYSGYHDISQLPPHTLREIRHFFEIYKELEKAGQVQVEDFRGRIDAQNCIRESGKAYARFRSQLLHCEYPDY